MNIIGISAHYHDSACCLISDGILKHAIEEERFTRIKHDNRIPIQSFQYCLKEENLNINDINAIAYYENPEKKISRQIWSMSQEPSRFHISELKKIDRNRAILDIREILGFEGKILFFDHHESHAASSFYYSGFKEAAVFTVDGVGEWETTTYASGNDKGLSFLESVNFPHSLGLLYSTITGYLGFKVNDGEYKVMGLAPYGQPKYLDKLRKLIHILPNGQYKLALEFFDFIQGSKMYSEKLCELFGRPARLPESNLDEFTKDLAKSLQVLLEEILIEKVAYLHTKFPSENLCMAGGVALNCVANGKVLKKGPFNNLFVQPASGDSGAALGAAALAHHKLTGDRIQNQRLSHVYLGPKYQDEEIISLLQSSSTKFEHYKTENELITIVAQSLSEGKVIGWFQEHMEFGPRSLGARSILADPRLSDMRDRINALVKKREGFRPFAPAVLAEKVHEHFDLDHESPFMLETCQVISQLDLPAITHIDKSARVQTVTKNSNLRFYNLIKAFDQITGCPIILNTSFNLRGEPIVCTPADAILCFIRSDLDILVLGSCVIDRKFLPQSWVEWYAKTSARRSTINHDVYTFI